MPTKEEQCCNKCFDEGVSQLSYGGCRNSNCECHGTTTKEEQKVNELLDEMKEVISDHTNRAYKDFNDEYWEHGSMRDVGVVSDNILEVIKPLLLTALRNKEKEVWEKIEESLPDEYDLTKSLSGTALYSERYGYNVCLTFIKQILQNIKNLSK